MATSVPRTNGFIALDHDNMSLSTFIFFVVSYGFQVFLRTPLSVSNFFKLMTFFSIRAFSENAVLRIQKFRKLFNYFSHIVRRFQHISYRTVKHKQAITAIPSLFFTVFILLIVINLYANMTVFQ